MSAYKDAFSGRAEKIARQAIRRPGSMRVVNGPASKEEKQSPTWSRKRL